MEDTKRAESTKKETMVFTEELLNKVKEFAEENFCKDEKEQFYVDDPEFAVSNPWYDHSGRFYLNDEEAVREWGLPVVLNYCAGALQIIQAQNERED